jgi:SpoIIAA-like
MIERIEGMPAGTIGLRGGGKFSKEDYVEILEPALLEGVESGEMRLLFVLDSFDGLEAGAWAEDLKTGLKAIVRDHAAWQRFAFVTDIGWVAKATAAFTWLIPGEARVFGLAEAAEAKSWVAG